MKRDFNSKRFRALLDAIRHSIKCPSCGGNFIDSDVDMVAGVNDAYFVKLACGKCGINIVASLVNIKDNRKISDLGEFEISFDEFEMNKIDADPISSDDLIDVHEFLTEFEGGFK